MTRLSCCRLIALTGAALLALPLASTPGRAAPTDTAAATRLDHISIVTMGRGDPVVLIPGLASPRETYAGIAASLAKSHRVILVQVNGFGGDAPGANIAPGMLNGVVADLDAYLVANHLGKAAVIGHSLGGLVALMLAKAHPGDVGRLMIVDALPYVGDIFLPGAQVAQVEPRARMMRDRLAAQYGQPSDPAAAAATATGLALHDDSRQQIAGWAAKADPRANAIAMYEDMTTDLRPALGEIAAPITVVYPVSAAMPADRAAAFYSAEFAAARHASFVAVPDSGHFVMLDQPQAFAQAVMTFLIAP